MNDIVFVAGPTRPSVKDSHSLLNIVKNLTEQIEERGRIINSVNEDGDRESAEIQYLAWAQIARYAYAIAEGASDLLKKWDDEKKRREEWVKKNT